jgi:hypothetical protein
MVNVNVEPTPTWLVIQKSPPVQLVELATEGEPVNPSALAVLKFDHQLELRGLLDDGQVSRLGALEDLVHIGGRPTGASARY